MMSDALSDAFEAASNGYSPDRVVADPELNSLFVTECRQRGFCNSVGELNQALLNLRKKGGLSGRERSKRTHFDNEDEYRFAAEIAIRFIERRDQVSLDLILCNPTRASEFDELAARNAPGYSTLQYRWAALNIRKSGSLTPELVGRINPPMDMLNFSVKSMQLHEVPAKQGVYLFFDSEELLYVGESENLRSRIKKHLDHSDNKGFARWLWESGTDDLNLEIQILEKSTSTRVRKAFELELIRSRQPVFNVKR